MTGIRITHSTQQRLVHRQQFQAWEAPQSVDTLCIDGGKVRIRTPLGEQSAWKDYKAVSLAEQGVGAYFQKNQQLVNWVNSQPFVDQVLKQQCAYLNGQFSVVAIPQTAN